jgi:hypothetical protein
VIVRQGDASARESIKRFQRARLICNRAATDLTAIKRAMPVGC